MVATRQQSLHIGFIEPAMMPLAAELWRYAAAACGVSRRMSYCFPEVAQMPEGKVQGPASYFPSIEKNYGKPVSHWFNVLSAMKGKKHMEMVAALKAEHKMGHGHANALVAYHRAKNGTDQ